MKKYDKVVLITGGCGFIGSHVVRHFVKTYPNYLIINLDAMTYAGNKENLKDIEDSENYIFEYADIRYYVDACRIFDQYQVTDVIHMAAESHVDRSLVNPFEFVETNVNGTVNLLNAANITWDDPTKEHVFFSMITDEIFGSLGEDDPPFNENTPLDPHSPYSTSKTAQYLFGKTYFESYGLPVISLACGNAIGPNQFPEKLVPLTIDRLMNGEKIPIYGAGEQMRDWTNVHDIVSAIDLLFHKGTPGELYCIGGDACKKNIDVVYTLIGLYATAVVNNGENELVNVEQFENKIKELKSLITFIPDPRGKSHDFRYDLDHTKITKELGWEPKYTFEESVWETLKWYMENQDWVKNVKNGDYKNWIDTYYGKEIDKK